MSTYAGLPQAPPAPHKGRTVLVVAMVSLAILVAGIVALAAIGASMRDPATNEPAAVEAGATDWDRAMRYEGNAIDHINRATDLLTAEDPAASARQLDLAADDLERLAGVVQAYPVVAKAWGRAADHVRDAADAVRLGDGTTGFREMRGALRDVEAAQAAMDRVS